MSEGPLHGLKVIEIASLAPAPFGCMLLADLGAEVLRVDRVGAGPAVSGPPGPLDRGIQTVALDLKSPRGVEALLALIRSADVFVEGFRPGVAERLGFGPTEMLEVNPRVIYARMTGWGQEGPLASRAGHDINYIALSGALEPLGRAGERPNAPANLLGDFGGGGTFLALGILAALFERERSGQGQVIDAAMVDGSATLTSFLYGMRAAGRWNGGRGENVLDGGASFYDTYETADGRYLAVGAVEPQFYADLLRGLGLEQRRQPDEAGWAAERTEFAAIFLTKSRDEWMDVYASLDACVTPVLTAAEAAIHPHNVARNSFVDVDGLTQPAPAPRFSRTPSPAPSAMDAGGRDPGATLRRWGLSDGEAAALLAEGFAE
jgi:alpha-methylacyl-CoA racemase